MTVGVFLRPLSRDWFNYIPAGPTPAIFCVLAQYHAMIPLTYRYRVTTSWKPRRPPPAGDNTAGGDWYERTITLSNKTLQYVIAFQLAILQWPISLLGAGVGWVVGYAWRMEVIPQVITRWRAPFSSHPPRTRSGIGAGRDDYRNDNTGQGAAGAEFERLRTRLEGEEQAATGVASGVGTEDGTVRERNQTLRA